VVHKAVKNAKRDLDRQLKMNKAFIDALPKIDKEIFEELGKDVVESSVFGYTSRVSGAYDEPKLKKEKGVFFA
jgi:hypothetical protein